MGPSACCNSNGHTVEPNADSCPLAASASCHHSCEPPKAHYNPPPPPPSFPRPLPPLGHLGAGGTQGVSVHRIPEPINKLDGHGRCGTVGEEGGVRTCIGRGGSSKGAVRKVVQA